MHRGLENRVIEAVQALGEARRGLEASSDRPYIVIFWQQWNKVNQDINSNYGYDKTVIGICDIESHKVLSSSVDLRRPTRKGDKCEQRKPPSQMAIIFAHFKQWHHRWVYIESFNSEVIRIVTDGYLLMSTAGLCRTADCFQLSDARALLWWRTRLATQDFWISYCRCKQYGPWNIFGQKRYLMVHSFWKLHKWYALSSCRLYAGIISRHNCVVSRSMSSALQLLWGAYQRQMKKNDGTCNVTCCKIWSTVTAET